MQKKVFGLQNNFRNNIIIFVVYLSVALSICPQKKRGNEKYNNNHIAAASQEKCKQPKCSRVIKLYGSRSIFPQRILSSLFLNDNDKKRNRNKDIINKQIFIEITNRGFELCVFVS